MRPAVALFAVVLGLLPVAGSAAPVLTPPDAGIDGLMQAYDGRVPGAAVLVLHDGQPVFRRGYGLAVVEDGTAVTAASNFRLASVSKQFTAAAVLLLVEDGRLGLNQPARQWLPELPPAAAAITIRQLLSHTSGLLDYEDLMDPADTRQVHDADVLTLLSREDRLNFAPGTQYRYSNSGYALLALIVGRASGQDFATFLQQRIFRPLGMAHTVAHRTAWTRSPRAPMATAGSTAAGSAPTRAPPAPCSAMAASIPRWTISPAGTPRCMTTGCCRRLRAARCSARPRPHRNRTCRITVSAGA